MFSANIPATQIIRCKKQDIKSSPRMNCHHLNCTFAGWLKTLPSFTKHTAMFCMLNRCLAEPSKCFQHLKDSYKSRSQPVHQFQKTYLIPKQTSSWNLPSFPAMCAPELISCMVWQNVLLARFSCWELRRPSSSWSRLSKYLATFSVKRN